MSDADTKTVLIAQQGQEELQERRASWRDLVFGGGGMSRVHEGILYGHFEKI